MFIKYNIFKHTSQMANCTTQCPNEDPDTMVGSIACELCKHFINNNKKEVECNYK